MILQRREDGASDSWPPTGWTYVLRAGRTLDVTNDFRTALDSGGTLGALLTSDNDDHVDRRLAAAGLVRRSRNTRRRV